MSRTFSVTVQPARKSEQETFGENVIRIDADPTEKLMDDGSKRIGVGFPVLFVSGWVSEPEKFAARVAELLTEEHSK